MTLWWQAAQGIGAIATAASFIVIFITFIIDRLNDRRQHRETYKLAFLEYTQKQKDRLTAFEHRYLKYKDDLLAGSPARDVYHGYVERYLRSSTEVSAYDLINEMPIFDSDDLLKLTNLVTGNPLLQSDLRLSFRLATGLLERLAGRLRSFNGVIDDLDAEQITEVFLLFDGFFSKIVFFNLRLLSWLLAKDSEELFEEKSRQSADYKRLKREGADIYGGALLRHRRTGLGEHLETLDEVIVELDRRLESAVMSEGES